MNPPRRVLITVDAVGGVWHYAVGLARALDESGIACLLLGFGPQQDAGREPLDLTHGRVAWCDAPLDWMVDDPTALHVVAPVIEAHARDWRADILHLNLPSQAARLTLDLPVVVASHSCLPTWWDAVRGGAPPAGWAWHRRLNADGFARADVVVVPSAGHGHALARVYGPIDRLQVVHNATSLSAQPHPKEDFVLAAGRWWDQAKNAGMLDAAAAAASWPILMAGPTAGPNGTCTRLAYARGLGPLSPAALHAMMRRAAVFAAPSLYEPFGLAVLEAARCGAALLLADIPTFRELWNGAAMFLPPNDPNAFAEAIRTLAAAQSRREQLAQYAHARAAAFTPVRQAHVTLAAYAAASMRRHASLRQVA